MNSALGRLTLTRCPPALINCIRSDSKYPWHIAEHVLGLIASNPFPFSSTSLSQSPIYPPLGDSDFRLLVPLSPTPKISNMMNHRSASVEMHAADYRFYQRDHEEKRHANCKYTKAEKPSPDSDWFVLESMDPELRQLFREGTQHLLARLNEEPNGSSTPKATHTNDKVAIKELGAHCRQAVAGVKREVPGSVDACRKGHTDTALQLFAAELQIERDRVTAEHVEMVRRHDELSQKAERRFRHYVGNNDRSSPRPVSEALPTRRERLSMSLKEVYDSELALSRSEIERLQDENITLMAKNASQAQQLASQAELIARLTADLDEIAMVIDIHRYRPALATPRSGGTSHAQREVEVRPPSAYAPYIPGHAFGSNGDFASQDTICCSLSRGDSIDDAEPSTSPSRASQHVGPKLRRVKTQLGKRF
ncbi:hypothetical protein C8Q80DRAFT_1190849 [Daedaleopsis nitida]|nr:hypothetical protein C8Q80DRAFT_1190849 [Daedaleopsis nitida]